MGMCYSCCKDKVGSSEVIITPDREVLRQQQLEATERRLREQESRGIKDPERVKRMQKRTEDLERRQEEAIKHDSGPGLKWQMN